MAPQWHITRFRFLHRDGTSSQKTQWNCDTWPENSAARFGTGKIRPEEMPILNDFAATYRPNSVQFPVILGHATTVRENS